MTAAITYILKWALALAMLYVPFALLLRKETFATFNRVLLIAVIITSAILPAITVTFPVEVEIMKYIDAAGNAVAEQPVQAAVAAAGEKLPWMQPSAMEALCIIYIIGAAAALALRIAEIARIISGIRHRTSVMGKQNGMTLHCHAGSTAPFSWFGHVVMSQDDYDECGREIMLHEEGHYRNGHSWDMLLLCAAKSLQWFNPFVYMLANDMKEIHEYEADRHVLKCHGNPRAYQLLLLRKAVGDTAFSIANGFSQSSVRKRIMMMARRPSPSIRKGKVLSFAPTALLFLVIFARPEYIYSTIEVKADKEEKQHARDIYAYAVTDCAPQPLRPAMPEAGMALPKEIETIAGMPLNSKGARLLERFEEHASGTLYQHVDIGSSETGRRLRAMSVRQCIARIEFICDKQGNAHSITGKSCNISLQGHVPGSIEQCKREATEAAIRHVKEMKWQPAIKNGKPMSTIFDAHIVLDIEEETDQKRYSSGHTMMAGSTPIN